jgi:hypothetical protein
MHRRMSGVNIPKTHIQAMWPELRIWYKYRK